MSRLEERIRIGIVGLGWVGQEVARAALEDARVSLVGVSDVDPVKTGRDLGEIIGEGRLGVPIDPDVERMLRQARPEVAVVCTTSDVEVLGPTLETCVSHGAHVVTTCENLADGELALAQLEPGFDDRAREAGVVVLATGVNPGFAMDRLPVMLAQATRNIRRIRVSRVVDASTRRAQLQAKIGVGRPASDFADAVRDGTIGHAGLSASLRLVAKGLGITLEKTSETYSPVIAAAPTTSTLGPVPAGGVRGVYQIARGYRRGREIITLELVMALGELAPRDAIDIVGEPPIHFEGELPGDECTVATVLSAISVVVNMQPGLRSVLDVPLEQPEEPPSTHRAGARAATELPLSAELALPVEHSSPVARPRPAEPSLSVERPTPAADPFSAEPPERAEHPKPAARPLSDDDGPVTDHGEPGSTSASPTSAAAETLEAPAPEPTARGKAARKRGRTKALAGTGGRKKKAGRKKGTGAGKEAMGTSKKGMGTGKKGMGTGKRTARGKAAGHRANRSRVGSELGSDD